MKSTPTSLPWYHQLLNNSRFWILAIAVTVSVIVAGYVQLIVPSGSLQVIRLEQWYGFLAFTLLFIAIIISPLTKVFPNLPGKASIVHARRAIGVSACYFALLHVYISFFEQLGGFEGIKYLNSTYTWALILGVFGLGVLCIMAATSFDWVVAHMGYKHWKLLHRLVYAASLTILLHVMLIGPHYNDGLTLLGILTYVAAATLIILEVLRIRLVIKNRHPK